MPSLSSSTMALKSNLVLFLSLSSLLVGCSPTRKRQEEGTTIDIDGTITSIRTALYVVANIEAGNATASCSDSDLVARLDVEGYDGSYAQELLYDQFLSTGLSR